MTIKGLCTVDLTFTVQGVYSLPYENSASIFFHRAYRGEAWPPFRGTVSTIWTRCADARLRRAPARSRWRRKRADFYENSPNPTKTESENAFTLGFVSLPGNVQLPLTAMGVIIIGVVVVIAANTIALNLRERVVEVAVLRTLGFSPEDRGPRREREPRARRSGVDSSGSWPSSRRSRASRGALMETRMAPFAAGMDLPRGRRARGGRRAGRRRPLGDRPGRAGRAAADRGRPARVVSRTG
ncbi:MAG: hypothetical protein IPL89_04510 [Acidobacteria bacterium]|nr:hypothetical protein [Acidobacteriota bacterium]